MKKRTNIKNRTSPIITSNNHRQIQVFALAWKNIVRLLQAPNIDITTLNILSSIIYQLTIAYTQMKFLELKSRELSLKGYALRIKKKQLFSNENENDPSFPLISKEKFRLIEQQLNFFPPD